MNWKKEILKNFCIWLDEQNLTVEQKTDVPLIRQMFNDYMDDLSREMIADCEKEGDEEGKEARYFFQNFDQPKWLKKATSKSLNVASFKLAFC